MSATGILLLDLFLVLVLSLYLLKRAGIFNYENFQYLEKSRRIIESRYRELALIVSMSATLGSLYFSNVLGWTPCKLCWLQRIFIYPLTFILATSLLFDRDNVQEYVLPLSMFGLAIAIYHYPIQITAMTSEGCSAVATSCDMTYTKMYGYITVPMMSITTLLTVIYLMIMGDKSLNYMP